MSDVERLKAELDMAVKAEVLGAAREAVHADRTPENIAAYKDASAVFEAARTAYRTNFVPPPPGEGDAVATPKTVAAKADAKVKEE